MVARDQPEFFQSRCRVAIALSSRNLRYLAESVAYLLAKGVAEVGITPLLTHDPGWRPEMIDELADQVAAIAELSAAELGRSGAVPFLPFRRIHVRRNTGGDGSPMCRAMVPEKAAGDVDGSVSRCVIFLESYQHIRPGLQRRCVEAARLGGIGDPRLSERLAGLPAALHAARAFDGKRDKHSGYGRCGNCRYLHRCCVCPACIGQIPGNRDPNRVSDLQCAVNLVLLAGRETFEARAAGGALTTP